MKEKKFINMIISLLAGLLLIVPLLIGQHADAAQPKPVKIGHLGEWTGPAAGICGPIGDGLIAYLHEYVNGEKGGIPYTDPKSGKILGKVKVEVIYSDGRYELPLFKSAFRKMLDQGVVLFHTTASPAVEGLKKDFRRDKVPCMVTTGNTHGLWPPEWLYGIRGSFADDMAYFVDWLMENWKEKRPPRVALMYADSPFGRGVLQGGPEYAEKKGVNIVIKEPVPMMPVDTTAQLLRIKKANVDWMVGCLIDPQVAVILKDKQRLGITTPEFELATTYEFIHMSGKAAEGVYYLANGYPLNDESYRGIKFQNEIYRKYAKNRGNKQYDTAWEVGLYMGTVIEEVLRLAMEKVHPDDLTGKKVREYGIHRVKDYDCHGINPKGITYFPGKDHRGAHYFTIHKAENGKPVLASDYRKYPLVLPPWMKK